MIGDLTHADLISRFYDKYVANGKFDGRHWEVLSVLYEFMRQECNGAKTRIPGTLDVDMLLPITKDFI